MNQPKSNSEIVNKTVVIVGSGIAGLFCSFVLSKRGFPVILLEKDETLGGRMLTEEIHPTKNKTFLIEGGAGVIRKDEEEIIDLMNELNVEMKYWKSETAIVYYDGNESKVINDDYGKLLQQVCQNAASNKSFGYIVNQADLDMEDKIGILLGTTYSELFEANSEHVCNENDFNEFMINDPNVEFGKPVRGWKAAVQALQDRITEYQGEIYTKSKVKEIHKNYVMVQVNNQKKLTKVEFSELIVTCPLHFMKNIKMTIPLNDWYMLANKMIQETDYLRVYSYFEKPFVITKKIATNLPLQRVIPINDQLIMTVYNDGSNATSIYRMHKNQNKLSEFIREQLELLLQVKVPKIKKNWSIYWNKGIASWKPSKTTPQEALPLINHPTSNVYFCGDTYSLHPGWITGAMESSIDVLGQIIDKYNP